MRFARGVSAVVHNRYGAACTDLGQTLRINLKRMCDERIGRRPIKRRQVHTMRNITLVKFPNLGVFFPTLPIDFDL